MNNSTDQKPMTVREILISTHGLSLREAEVCELSIMTGKPLREIGNMLFITEKTVKFHLTHIYFKLNVRKRDEMLMKLMPILGGVERYAKERAAQSQERVQEVIKPTIKPMDESILPTGAQMNSEPKRVPITPFWQSPDLTHVRTEVPEEVRPPTFSIPEEPLRGEPGMFAPIDPVEHLAARAEKLRAEKHPHPNLKRKMDEFGITERSLEIACQCWQDAETSSIILDHRLVLAFAKRVEKLRDDVINATLFGSIVTGLTIVVIFLCLGRR